MQIEADTEMSWKKVIAATLKILFQKLNSIIAKTLGAKRFYKGMVRTQIPGVRISISHSAVSPLTVYSTIDFVLATDIISECAPVK